MKQLSIFLAGVAVLALSACGGPKKLTPEQRAQFEETMSSATRARSASGSLGRSGPSPVAPSPIAPNPNITAPGSFTTGATASRSSGNDSDNTQAEMMAKLQACTPEGDPSKMEVGKASGAMEFKLSGAGCPVAMRFAIDMKGDKGSIDLSYEVKDEKFAALNDVTGMAIHGEFDKREAISLTGSIQSRRYGKLPFRLEMGQHDMKLSFQFKDFEVVVEGREDGKNGRFTINGEEMDSQRGMTYLSTLGAM